MFAIKIRTVARYRRLIHAGLIGYSDKKLVTHSYILKLQAVYQICDHKLYDCYEMFVID